MTQISILIADDHELVKDAVALALSQNGEFVVSTASSLADTVSYLEEHGNIDVVMLDLVMPGMEGVSSVKKVVELNGDGAVVLFSGNADPRLLDQAINAGCAGLIPKSLPLKSLSSVLKFIHSGQVFMPMIAQLDQDKVKSVKFTARDISILISVADGKTNKEIARQLSVSEVTIKARMRSICSKLGASNRTSAVTNARSAGII